MIVRVGRPAPVRVKVQVGAGAVLVAVDVDLLATVAPDRLEAQPDHEHTDGQLEGEREALAEHPSEAENREPGRQKSERVAEPPEEPDHGGLRKMPSAAHDRGHGHDVIRVEGVPRPEQQSEAEDDERGGLQPPNPTRRAAP